MNTNDSTSVTRSRYDRRSLLKTTFAGASALVTTAASASNQWSGHGNSTSGVLSPMSPEQRRNEAYNIRLKTAIAQKNLTLPPHPTNGDDNLYPNFIGSFTKALAHNSLGEVTPASYTAYLNALKSGSFAAFNAIPLGGTVKLANPQAAYSFQLEGADSHHLAIPPAPALNSAWAAGEMTEVYWRAWTRDIAFIEYASDSHVAAAAADLSTLPDFRGPKTSGAVTADTLFRGPTPGDLTGPHVSQFLYKDIPFGATTIPQRYRTTVPGDNHMTTFAHWLAVQNGSPAPTAATPDITPRYIANGRDLAEYVHVDFSYQAFQSAALILLGFGSGALDDYNPYKTLTNQGGFVTFGGPMILDLVARAGIEGLKAAWCQKWLVHRRLRPEAYAGLVHNHVTGAASYPLHSSVLNSTVLANIFGAYGTYLLPMAFPEGSPTHPAYPAGHATIAGACVTVLKAFFKETFAIPSPVQTDADGLALLPYAGGLTVGGELNKLASNISLGRDTGGVHWRTDGIEGMKLGEEVAIHMLREHKTLNRETFAGFSLTKFDGSTIVI